MSPVGVPAAQRRWQETRSMKSDHGSLDLANRDASPKARTDRGGETTLQVRDNGRLRLPRRCGGERIGKDCQWISMSRPARTQSLTDYASQLQWIDTQKKGPRTVRPFAQVLQPG